MKSNKSFDKHESDSKISPLPTPKITNVVSTADLSTNLNLRNIFFKVV